MRTRAFVAAALLLSGCNSIPGLKDNPDDSSGQSQAQAVERVRSQAMHDLDVSASSAISLSNGTRYLSSTIAVTNRGTEPFSAAVQADFWLIRVFDSPTRSDAPVWSTEDANRSIQLVARPLVIAPGETQTFHSTPERIDMVFAGRSAGTYYVSVALRLAEPKTLIEAWPAGEVTFVAP